MISRWKPNRRHRWFRPRWRRRGRRLGRRMAGRGTTPTGVGITTGYNNTWGYAYRHGRLVWSTSAGATPAGRGSHRGGRLAPAAVVTAVGTWLSKLYPGSGSRFRLPYRRRRRSLRHRRRHRRWGDRGGRRRRLRWRPTYTRRIRRVIHRRRWRSRRPPYRRRTRLGIISIHLAGPRGPHWKKVLSSLNYFFRRRRRRVVVTTHFVRPHNGLRPVKARRI